MIKEQIEKTLKEYRISIKDLLDAQKYQEAQQLMTQAKNAYPNNDKLELSQALIYFNSGENQLAIKSFEKSLSMNDEQPMWVLQKLSKLYSLVGDHDKYLQYQKEIADKYFSLGEIIEATKHYANYLKKIRTRKLEPDILNRLIFGILYIIKTNKQEEISLDLIDFVNNKIVAKYQYLCNKLSLYSLNKKPFIWLGEAKFFYQIPPLNKINYQLLACNQEEEIRIFYSLNINYPDSQILQTESILTRIPKPIKELLKQGQAYLVLDSSSERHLFSIQYIKAIDKIIDKLGIQAKQIFYLNQNANFFTNFESWYKKQENWSSKPNLIYFNRAMIDLLYTQENTNQFFDIPDSIKAKDKKFLCLNNIPRAHRAYVLYWLIKNDLLKDGLVSFNHCLDHPTLTGHKNFKNKDYLAKFFPTYTLTQLSEIYKDINSYLPLYLDLKDRSKLNDNGRGQYVKQLPTDLFQRTYFSIVTESDFDNGKLGFTEKLIKPLLFGHPFIVIGAHGMLELIHNLGFKTFNGFIDESYDQKTDSLTRINMALNEVNKLCQYSYPELDSWYQEITPILHHNFEHFTQNILSNSLKDFEDKFLRF